MKTRATTVLALPAAAALALLCPLSALRAQFNPIGFEGATINGIPYASNVGIPSGTPVNTSFSYTFQDGNNLQSFTNPAAGTVDSDDIGSGVSTSSTAVPDYYKSSEFGWKIDGWVAGTTANWGVFDASFVGNGASNGTDYPGGVAGRTTELGEAININRNFSPAAGNLAKAPGLGDQFLDTHGTSNGTPSAQLSLDFFTSQSTTFTMTLAFGGRDSGSATQQGFYRVLENGSTVLFSGSTSDTPFEHWQPIDTNNPSAGATAAATTNNVGVIQKNWEYFRQSFAVSTGKTYTLQLLLPDALNFDFALGLNATNVVYTNTPGLSISPVPEASSFGLAAVGMGAAFVLLRRRPRAV